jgi:hypothetical protein
MIVHESQPSLTQIRRSTAMAGQILLHRAGGLPGFPISTSAHWRCAPRLKWDYQPPSSGSTVEDSWAERVFLPVWTSSARTSGIPGDAIGSAYPASPPRARCASRTAYLSRPSAIWPSPQRGRVGNYAPETAPVAFAGTGSQLPGTAGPSGQQKQLDQVNQHAMSGPRAMCERLQPDQYA